LFLLTAISGLPVVVGVVLAWLCIAVYLTGRALREARNATSTVLAALLIAALPVGLVAQVVLAGVTAGHPTDGRLIREFHSHTNDFERLLAMFREDRQLGRIAPGFTRPANFFSGKPLPEGKPAGVGRLAEYWALFAKLSLSAGIEGYDDKEMVRFIRSTRGLSISGSSKGYAYMEVPPELVVESLDDYWSGDGRSFTAFRHIEGNWYLYFDFED
jgi:hypothetical protein